jgi:hypothetical protein
VSVAAESSHRVPFVHRVVPAPRSQPSAPRNCHQGHDCHSETQFTWKDRCGNGRSSSKGREPMCDATVTQTRTRSKFDPDSLGKFQAEIRRYLSLDEHCRAKRSSPTNGSKHCWRQQESDATSLQNSCESFPVRQNRSPAAFRDSSHEFHGVLAPSFVFRCIFGEVPKSGMFRENMKVRVVFSVQMTPCDSHKLLRNSYLIFAQSSHLNKGLRDESQLLCENDSKADPVNSLS